MSEELADIKGTECHQSCPTSLSRARFVAFSLKVKSGKCEMLLLITPLPLPFTLSQLGGVGGWMGEGGSPCRISIIRNGHVDFKKTSCRPVDFKKTSCRPVDFKKRAVSPCSMSLRPKNGRVALSILGSTPITIAPLAPLAPVLLTTDSHWHTGLGRIA